MTNEGNSHTSSERRVPNKINLKCLTKRYIIIKMPKVKDKENIKSSKKKSNEKHIREHPQDFRLISQQKLCRPKEIGTKYSEFLM